MIHLPLGEPGAYAAIDVAVVEARQGVPEKISHLLEDLIDTDEHISS